MLILVLVAGCSGEQCSQTEHVTAPSASSSAEAGRDAAVVDLDLKSVKVDRSLGFVAAAELRGKRLYLVGDAGLVIERLDGTKPLRTTRLAHVPTGRRKLELPPELPEPMRAQHREGVPMPCNDVALYADHAFVTAGTPGSPLQELRVYHVGTPTPVLVAELAIGAKRAKLGPVAGEPGDHAALGIVVDDRGIAYVGAAEAGMLMIDVKAPAKPAVVGTFTLDDPSKFACTKVVGRVSWPTVSRISLDGDQRYVAFVPYGASGLHIVDVTKPASPDVLGSFDLDRTWYRFGAPKDECGVGFRVKRKADYWFNSVVVRGDTAYVAADWGGILALDIENPKAPKLVAHHNPWHASQKLAVRADRDPIKTTPGRTVRVRVLGDVLLATAAGAGLYAWDVSNPRKLVPLARVEHPKKKLGLAWGVAADQHLLVTTYWKPDVTATSGGAFEVLTH